MPGEMKNARVHLPKKSNHRTQKQEIMKSKITTSVRPSGSGHEYQIKRCNRVSKNIYTTVLLLYTMIAGAQIVNIPDANFKARLIFNGYDTNNDGEIQVSEAEAVTGPVNLSPGSFSDMTGIEAFLNMESLECNENGNLTSVSISNLPNLKSLHLDYNSNLISLNLANLTALDSLSFEGGAVTALEGGTLPALKYFNGNSNHLNTVNLSSSTQLRTLLYGNNSLVLSNLQLPAVNIIETVNCSGNGLSSFNASVFPQLKKLDCSNNALNVFTVPALPFLEELYCGNNQMTSLTLNTALPSLKRLECAGGFLPTLDLSPFPTLEILDVGGNHLTALNLTGLVNLRYLAAALNDVPGFNLTPLTNLEYVSIAGNLHTTLDVSNLIHLDKLFCGSAPMTALNLANTPALTILDCQDAQLASLDLSGHPELQQVNCGINPLGSLDLTGAPNLYALNCWQNQLTSLDVSMLPNLAVLSCHDNLLTTLDCSQNHVLGNLDIYANPLETLFIKNGTQQYFNDTGNFVENPELTYICADEEEISYLLAKPGMNASVNTYCSLPPGGDYNTITGHVAFDTNNNGCDDFDAPGSFIKIGINDGSATSYGFVNGIGNYQFFTGSGGFTLTPETENPSYFNISPASAVVNFPLADNSFQDQPFCVSANGVHQDLEIVIAPIFPARPGFEAVYKIVIRNKGNQTMSMPLGYSFSYNPDLMTFVGATTTPESQAPGLMHWDYTNLQPFESRSVEVVMQINAPTHPTHPVNVGDELTFTSVIETIGGDELPGDNAFQFNQIVIGSYDPNNMICIEGDIEPVENIGGYLHYIANFENTGTDFAENIVVKTVFDPSQFDVSSLRVLEGSDPVVVRVNGNMAEYIFNGINLEIGGHGNILLKIKTRDNLTNGDMVANRADIYFDYNLPITTNDAETTFQLLSAGHPDIDASVAIYPNPTNGILNITAATNIQTVQLFDVQGRLLQTAVRDEPSVTIDLSGKQSGIYFVKVTSVNGIGIQKVVKE